MVNKFYYLRGGAERYCFDMTQLLQRYGHTVIPFSMDHERNRDSEYAHYFVEEISFERSAGLRRPVTSAASAVRAIYSLQAQQRLVELIKCVKPDVAYLNNIHHQISLSILRVLKDNDIPIVWRLHDYSLFCPNSQFYSGHEVCEACAGGRYFQIFLKKCRRGSRAVSLIAGLASYYDRWRGLANLVDIFVAPSDFLRAKMVQYGLDSRKVLVIPNFIDLSSFESEVSNRQRRGEDGGSEGPLIYFGRLSREKGLKTLISAMAQVPEWRLSIVGDGPQRQELESFAEMTAPGSVMFTGYQRKHKLFETLLKASIVILPSEWYENCPYTILEAFAMEKPVIASNVGGIPELVKPGKDGLLFEAGDSADLAGRIRYLLNNAPAIHEFGRNGRRKINEKYSADLHYTRSMDVFSTLMARK